MKSKPSPLICARCGLPVRRWLDGWKHSAGGNSKSCGKPPEPISRAWAEAGVK